MATTNYGFTLLTGSDIAGYNSINTLITSIDTQLLAKGVSRPGTIVIFDTSISGIPTGWTNLTNTVSGLPTLSGTYVYIKKSA